MVNEDMQLHYSCIHAISLLLLKQMSGQNYNDFCQALFSGSKYFFRNNKEIESYRMSYICTVRISLIDNRKADNTKGEHVSNTEGLSERGKI